MRRSGNRSGWSGKRSIIGSWTSCFARKEEERADGDGRRTGKICVCAHLTQTRYAQKACAKMGRRKKNKRKPMKINLRLFYMFDSCGLDSALRDSANRTLTCAGTAVNAFSSVDFELAFSHRDSANRTLAFTRTT